MTSASDATHIPTRDPRVRRFPVLLGSLLFVSLLLATPTSAQKSIIVNPHGDLSLPVDCSACHTSESFVPARRDMDFDHNRQTSFPLLGRHTDVACATCHLDLRFDEPEIEPTACASCHVDVHQGSMIESCATCHNTSSFSDVDGFAIHNQTSFPLTGAHEQIICESCHVDDVGGAFSALDPSCESCHQDDYAAAASIDHVGLGFPQTCEQCHSTRTWGSGDLFDHTTASGGFELVGAHANARCSSCHMSPGLQPIFEPASPDDCFTCHQSDYQTEHAGSGFPTTCTTCHGTDSWTGSGSFDHVTASGGFDLVGAHVVAACESCHAPQTFEPLFAATSNDDCFTCHQSDYETAHAGMGFPTTCTTCHGNDTWAGARFDNHDQDYFPIYSGTHRGEWDTCQTCHTNQSNFEVFTCLTCHEHSQARMDDKHSEQNGYVYESTACLSCHPRGNN